MDNHGRQASSDKYLQHIATSGRHLMGLIEDVLEVPGTEAVTWWRVHPQVLLPAS